MVNLTIEQLQAVENPRDAISKYANGWYRTHSRPHNYALLEALKKEFPEMWNQGRLGMIPVGDVMLALDEKIKAGDIPPLKSVCQFSEGHMRSGLPRYMLGATFYAVLFKDHPARTIGSPKTTNANIAEEGASCDICLLPFLQF